MKEINVDDLVQMNQNLITLLGYGSAFIHKLKEQICVNDVETAKYNWYMNAIQNLSYQNKKLPEAP